MTLTCARRVEDSRAFQWARRRPVHDLDDPVDRGHENTTRLGAVQFDRDEARDHTAEHFGRLRGAMPVRVEKVDALLAHGARELTQPQAFLVNIVPRRAVVDGNHDERHTSLECCQHLDRQENRTARQDHSYARVDERGRYQNL